jgi:hypothetical protein
VKLTGRLTEALRHRPTDRSWNSLANLSFQLTSLISWQRHEGASLLLSGKPNNDREPDLNPNASSPRPLTQHAHLGSKVACSFNSDCINSVDDCPVPADVC